MSNLIKSIELSYSEVDDLNTNSTKQQHSSNGHVIIESLFFIWFFLQLFGQCIAHISYDILQKWLTVLDIMCIFTSSINLFQELWVSTL